jgi:ribonuclease VapC
VIVDTSAIVAMLRAEPEAPAFARTIAAAPIARISAATYVELSSVIDGSRDPVLSGSLDPFLASARIQIEPLTAEQARIARTAYQRFGRGSGHSARLNMGDCFAYALARDLGEPLLFKGDDFKQTDIELVTEPIRGRRLSEIVAAYGTPTA